MANGLEISVDFINEIVVPMLKIGLKNDFSKVAVSVIGSGSDVLGLDDEISRDHHWGPRANVMYLHEDAQDLGPQIHSILADCPAKYREFDVSVDIANMSGFCASEFEGYFHDLLGGHHLPPQKDIEWLDLCEVDLFHATAGKVVYDGPGNLTRLREDLRYYPDIIWKKRIADWCMYISGRDSPYNYHRVSKRGDRLTGRIYLALYTKRVMEFCFTLNKQYAPYTKWLNRLFRTLPKYVDSIAPMLDKLLSLENPRDIVMQQVDINYHLADAVAELGLTETPVRQEFDESLTDLVLYYSAAQIYRTLPIEYLDRSFNTIEHWEPLARKAILDPNDFVQMKAKS